MTSARRGFAFATAAVASALTAVATAAPVTIDLRTDARVKVTGNADAVAAAGDVNGDGRPDYLVGGCAAGGEVYVVFGPPERRRLDLDAEAPGFRIEGPRGKTQACYFAGAGDVDGDGLDDVVVGAPLLDANGRTDSGSAFVVFGKSDEQTVLLQELVDGSDTAAGFRIDGAGERDLAGHDVAGLGDVNQDGRADVAVGAPFGGATYVVFGRDDTSPVDLMLFDLNAQGLAGYRVATPSVSRNQSYSVAGGGDVNGDGRPDLAVGLYEELDSTGGAFVVFGKSTTDPVDVEELGLGGFAVEGAEARSTTGHAVSIAQDVDGDGLADVVVGAPFLYCCGPASAYVVFGSASTNDVELANLGDRGFRIRGRWNDGTGIAVASAGDVDGDARGDVIVGAPFRSSAGRDHPGVVYVVRPRSAGGTVDLRKRRIPGIRIVGARDGGAAGWSVAGPGDLDGDGTPDVLLSAQVLHKAYVVTP